MPLRDEIEQLKSDINFIKNEIQFIRDMVLAMSNDSELVKDAAEVRKNAEAMLNALKENKRIIRPKV
jgi:Mg2+ and Co2+ transporter CorA